MIAQALRVRSTLAAAIAITALATVATPYNGTAFAAAPGPHWALMSIPTPTYFHAGDVGDFYEVAAVDDGGADTTGETVVVDILPRGITVTSITGYVEAPFVRVGSPGGPMTCGQETSRKVVTVTCRTSRSLPAGRLLAIKINVNVPASAEGPLSNSASVSGGGAPEAGDTNETPVTPASRAAPFGVAMVSDIVEASGTLDTRAGSHPWAYTTLLAYNTRGVNTTESCAAELGPREFTTTGCAEINGVPRDVEVALPPGLIGNPTAVPRCSQRSFQNEGWTECPADTQVGVVDLSFFTELSNSNFVPVYNIEPPPGQPAELGFSVSAIGHVGMFFHVRGGSDYALTANVSNITQFLPVRALAMTIWGVPANEAHRPLRMASEDPTCLKGTTIDCATDASLDAYLTMPTNCSSASLPFVLGTDSWESSMAPPLPADATDQLPGVAGCEALTLSGPERGGPTLAIKPTTSKAGVPAGYGVTLTVPQNEEPEGLATPQIKNVEVTMPTGTVINPSAANGLVACSEAQFARASETIGRCPIQSKIGTVKIASPLIETPLTGNVYVGEPECSPCSPSQAAEGKMIHLLIEARLPNPNEAGMSQEEREAYRPAVLIKLSGHTRIDQANGQLTTAFDENPQLPFDELTLSLEDGPDAPLVNPSSCGPIVANASLTPWSGLSATNIASPPVSIEGCMAQGFSPSFAAGMTGSAQAGAFSGFSVTISRPGGQQDLGAVTVHTPPGISGIVNGLPLCGEPQANEGTCPSGSQIGEATTVLGAGTEPYTVTGGKVYLTTGYGGGSFGLSVVVPAEAGPFRLSGLNGTGGEGNGSVVIRGLIEVNPTTAALTIKTNAIPTALDGIPLHIQKVIVNVNRPNFMFNPTSCDAKEIESTIASSTGTNVSSSYPFQATGCSNLKFTPNFTASTSNKTSKADGAALNVHLAFPAGAFGSQANMHLVKVELPKQLPSRLTTLQKACTAAQFEANPAGCPAESIVGHARAITPILPVPLEGPAYFVSHGGEAFPNLTMVLQGYGVTVELVGDTLIKNGITSSTFKTIPDVPVSNFELSLPAQPYSALTATANLCASPLVLPTEMIGQNGATIHQNTPLTVEGCKPALDIVRHEVHNGTVTILVKVPSGGKILASGRGLTRASKRPNKAKLVTLTLKLTKHERTTLARLRGRKLRSAITLTFTPTHGTKLSSKVTVLVR